MQVVSYYWYIPCRCYYLSINYLLQVKSVMVSVVAVSPLYGIIQDSDLYMLLIILLLKVVVVDVAGFIVTFNEIHHHFYHYYYCRRRCHMVVVPRRTANKLVFSPFVPMIHGMTN